MTTIACAEGVMAADRRLTDDNFKIGTVSKLFVIKEGIVGITGAYSDAMAFVAWAQKGYPARGRPEAVRDVEAIILKHDGTLVLRTAPLWNEEPVDAPFYAAGTGGPIAIGAMAMGADPMTAVEIASTYDVFSGDGVDVLTLAEVKRKSTKRKPVRRRKSR